MCVDRGFRNVLKSSHKAASKAPLILADYCQMPLLREFGTVHILILRIHGLMGIERTCPELREPWWKVSRTTLPKGETADKSFSTRPQDAGFDKEVS
jgi:hypothetical protein